MYWGSGTLLPKSNRANTKDIKKKSTSTILLFFNFKLIQREKTVLALDFLRTLQSARNILFLLVFWVYYFECPMLHAFSNNFLWLSDATAGRTSLKCSFTVHIRRLLCCFKSLQQNATFPRCLTNTRADVQKLSLPGWLTSCF